MNRVEGLGPLVAAWLPQQRWFAGKGRPISEISVRAVANVPGTEPPVTIWVAHVDYADGTRERYQVPLLVRTAPVDQLEHVLLGTVDLPPDHRPGLWVYDALHDKDVTAAWLVGIRDAISTDQLHFTRLAEPDEIPVDEASLVLTGEQSNTSLMYGDVAIMKVFRRLQPGVNPDIEVQAALSELGARHIARLLGTVEADVDGEPVSLAMLQEFMTTATDGWELAKASVRDLMAEADLHAEEAGGDFAAEAKRLGEAVASVHADLGTAFGVREASSDELHARADAMGERLRRALEVVPQLADVAGALSAAYASVGELSEPVPMQRIHGDLHLGQALRTVTRWVLIDFEGEPMTSMDERRTFDSPLRDIAGMLRSFEYAGHHRVIETGYDPQLTYRAAEWSSRNRDAFCSGYAQASGQDPYARGVLLRAFEADKAVYEAVYEARNRPAWLPIPLASLTRLAEGAA